jgi:hypothetical protein
MSVCLYFSLSDVHDLLREVAGVLESPGNGVAYGGGDRDAPLLPVIGDPQLECVEDLALQFRRRRM